jgi:hypothetical protein
VFITKALASNSRLTEIEAYAVLGSVNHTPDVTLTGPATGATFTMPSPVVLDATATDSDGTVSQVDFYANGALVGTDTTGMAGAFSVTWTPAVAGNYTLTAVATDNGGATKTSNPVTIALTPPAGRVNVALAARGSLAAASSTYGSGYPASGVINGDRKGLGWGSGGGWADGTSGVWPDWVEVQFNGAQPIEEIDVFTLQDSYATPSDPTLGMTFTKYGVRDFSVEYWTGTSWQPVPGASVTNNTFVWCQFYFAPVTTSRIRVFITKGLASNSRVTEVEAYAVLGGENHAPNVTLTSPASGATFTMPSPVVLDATATDSDGTVSQVDFYANGALVGTDTTGAAGAFSLTWTPAIAGTYTVTAVASDDAGATKTSSPITITLTPPAGRVNVALAANGSLAVASSTYGSGYPPAGAINGDRKGLGWGSGGGWSDGTSGAWPDWIEVQFNGAQSIEEIDLFTVQDSYATPSDPTLSMTFTKYGVRDFRVEYWTGSTWQPVPGGIVTDNTRVWRQFNFAPLTTTRIRVFITKALASNSRLVEIEAYAPSGG